MKKTEIIYAGVLEVADELASGIVTTGVLFGVGCSFGNSTE